MPPVLLTPVKSSRSILPAQNNAVAVTAQVAVEAPQGLPSVERLPFIEANTKEVTMHHLQNDCIIPVFSKDNEITISHGNFIETLHEALQRVFPREQISSPSVRVSHMIKGRIPEAIHKPVGELLESDKTIYYERMAFCFDIHSIHEQIGGNMLHLSVGGVRAYNHENLFSRKSSEKFKVFIGFQNRVCCNLCISTDGYKDELRAMSTADLLKSTVQLFQSYRKENHLGTMRRFEDSILTEHQFAQLVGKSRLYQCLPAAIKKTIPAFEFNDGHINLMAKSYYQDEYFGRDSDSGEINLWKLFNLFTGANKNSYIDSFLDRSVNASDVVEGIQKALHGDDRYRWFIE